MDSDWMVCLHRNPTLFIKVSINWLSISNDESNWFVCLFVACIYIYINKKYSSYSSSDMSCQSESERERDAHVCLSVWGSMCVGVRQLVYINDRFQFFLLSESIQDIEKTQNNVLNSIDCMDFGHDCSWWVDQWCWWSCSPDVSLYWPRFCFSFKHQAVRLWYRPSPMTTRSVRTLVASLWSLARQRATTRPNRMHSNGVRRSTASSRTTPI